jgi:cytochrome P450
MITHPEVQRKAHEELDSVIGRGRLPDLEDKQNLPYIDAIYKEVSRLHPPFPLGVPHAVIADDEYRGMRIPKDSALFANVW